MVSWIEVAQDRCPDPVVAASLFKPNAPGSWELASFAALSERQLLKASGSYFAERVLVAVTTVEVAAIEVGLSRAVRHRFRSWRHDELVVAATSNRDGRVPLPALSLRRRFGWPCMEVAPRDADSCTIAVFDRLIGCRVPRDRSR